MELDKNSIIIIYMDKVNVDEEPVLLHVQKICTAGMLAIAVC
jgi:hypothetical protein